MGFGHRVYKTSIHVRLSSRSNVISFSTSWASKIHSWTSQKELEQAALEDEYFVERKLYPNVDFYSGIIYKALGFPANMFTVLFAMGRLPGWIAQWREMREDQEPYWPPARSMLASKRAVRTDSRTLSSISALNDCLKASLTRLFIGSLHSNRPLEKVPILFLSLDEKYQLPTSLLFAWA